MDWYSIISQSRVPFRSPAHQNSGSHATATTFNDLTLDERAHKALINGLKSPKGPGGASRNRSTSCSGVCSDSELLLSMTQRLTAVEKELSKSKREATEKVSRQLMHQAMESTSMILEWTYSCSGDQVSCIGSISAQKSRGRNWAFANTVWGLARPIGWNGGIIKE